ncbi:hypothetical protein K432DRAFT_289370 [Lepidopterella palustris CBS 459.81]|uniref:PHD-type domain-containing protein n=1 Tax=Lepidopterella palustris CBS 459.81 TaxID=1314670 RepID=A0A8E2JJ16_9PEZI|nr:hypothetical protein K432DRAFT_289370 [Lepidopterella palustris CBS 459.81]
MDFSQMQTPPPTRDASCRREDQQALGAELTTPSTVVSRSVSTPATNGLPLGNGFYSQTPLQFSSLNFSPDVIQFPSTGPMSAPAFPQSRLFWDHNNDGSGMDVDMPMASDPFGPTHKTNGSVNWQSFGIPSDQMNMQAFHDLNGLTPPNQLAPFLMNGMSEDKKPDNSRPNSFISTTSGVDPSLLFSFSSPSTAMSGNSINPRPTNAGADLEGRQPYEHQIRESNREKELARKAKSQHSRTNTSSSSGSTQDSARPSLQRSNTDSGFRKSKTSSIDSRSSGSSTGHHIPRKSSPLKRQSQGSLTSIPEITRSRPRTRLVIDETGRARTETDPVKEGDARKDLKLQYPGLWNEEESDSDSDQAVLSRNASFAIQQPKHRSSKHARADSGLERTDSFKIPRPTSMSFENNSFGVSRSGGGFEIKNQKASDNPFRRYSMSSFGGSYGETTKTIDGVPGNPSNSNGDAQGALKKVVEGRMKRNERTTQGTLQAHNQRWAQASADLARPGVSPQMHYDTFTKSFNPSPITMANPNLTPSTDRSSLASEGTRCVCNSSEYDGQLMIQCESCTKWLHVRCVGLNQHSLPPVYVCIFCTGQTPAVRGGRVREHIRAIPQFDSPLTHKSTYRR